ncbi:hypothetical protein [Chryseobacterium limigenitum]|uniref:PepSY-associated TM region n=1 Tax=Chryseobacterium limigenitum TaxID=1612149 RepID=A0A1K2ISP7_9FLAO|nr:hypothetical protein [Chryseobacterium limigenitum]SFZ95461.1 hypothetical protein SAMN05216324_11029 [Chryseobacterium limigenitum]
MDKIKNTRSFMRITHRYLGYFLAGIMAVYAVSGVLLVYRDTDFLKKEKKYEKIIAKNLNEKELGKELKMKNFEVEKTEGDILKFKQGTYNSVTGEAKYSKKELPFVLDKMTKLHKSQSKDKLSPLNTFFGIALFFFVISSFWMFNPKTKAFKRGIIFTVAGLVISIILLFI